MIKEFWNKYEYKIILVIVFLLVSVVSFEFGYMQKEVAKTSPIVIEKAPESSKISPEGQINGIMASNNTVTQKALSEANLSLPKDCAFVGSKNSTKYHATTCSWAKRILPKNLVCFKAADEAIAQGRIGDKACIK